MIIDNFLASFAALKTYAQSIEYDGITNPEDGVTYPDVNGKIPGFVFDQIQDCLDFMFHKDVLIRSMFLRLTALNTSGAPHQAHTDSVMGDYTLLLYLNDGPGGTSLVRHKETGMDVDPGDDAELLRVWQRDTNVPDAWEITEMIEMKENRANIIESHLMHRAEPPGGFGVDPRDGRIVLTAFFE